jgi:conjugative transfer signal peptidase TraF
LLGATATATTLVFLSALPHTPIFVWNGTASAPVGLYLTVPATDAKRGDLVLATPPIAAQRLAVSRGYLGAHVPLIKYVAALQGDVICAKRLDVTIDGVKAVSRLAVDSKGRPLDAWTGCRTLGSTEVFLLNPAIPQSFDSRYFGPVSRQSIIAALRPLWTR